MCITLAAALGYAATAGQVLAGVAAIDALTKGSGPDPGEAQARSDALAAQSGNAKLAQRRRALRKNSLLTSNDTMSTGILNGGRPTLGG